MAQPPNYPEKPPAYNPGFQGGAPQPQQGYPPQQQGYPPQQQGYPPQQQGYPPQQQGYPPQQQGSQPQQKGQQAPPPHYPQQQQAPPAQNTVVYQSETSSLGRSLGGLFKSAEKALNSASNTVSRDIDRYAATQTLMMFNNGNVITLKSRESGRYLQVLPNGTVDGNGMPNQLSAQFAVLNTGHNIVILRSAAYQTCHIGNHGGRIVGNGNGDHSCKFRLHETTQGFITFECVTPVDNHIGVTSQGTIIEANLVRKDSSAMFVPAVVSLPYAKTVNVQQTTTYRK